MVQEKVTVLARMKAKTGKEDEVRREILSLVGPTRAEEGCINYDLHRSMDDASVFILYENWRSKEDLDDHLAKPYLQAFLGKTDLLLAEPPEIKLWEMISAAGS